MKLTILANSLILVPLAVCTAQTQSKPPAPTPKPPVVSAPSTAAPAPVKPSLSLEDVPGADPVVITIGDERITKSEFERLLAALPEQARAQAQGPGKKKIAEQVAELKLMAQEARKRGVDRKPETRELIAFQTDNLLANALYRDITNSVKPDEAADRAYYDGHKTEYEQVKASHILIRFKGSPVPLKPNQKDLTEEEALAKAQELRKRLIAGEDFAKLATAESDDSTAAKQGGSLGSFSRGHMVPAFEQAAFNLPAGQVSEPVKTQFGYHLIKVDEHATQKFEEVQSSIEQKLKPELARKAVDDIRKQTPITLNEGYFAK
jgi:peptidyl-prolyl cis-trans isomerase C